MLTQELRADNSRLYKEEVLSKYLNDIEIQVGLTWALDPLITFGVKQVPKTKEDGEGLSFSEFTHLARKLINRELTGHDARDAIQAAADQALIEEWNEWYRLILIKDLRCGVSEKTVNKVAKSMGLTYRVPTFACMLATDGTKHPKSMKGRVLVEYKYDGVRVLIVVKDGVGTMYSRSGKEITNFPQITQSVTDLARGDCVIDGEIMSENFQELMKQLRRDKDVDTSDAYLVAFDIIPLLDFIRGGCDTPLIDRKDELDTFIGSNIKVVDYTLLDLDTDSGKETYSEMNRVALKEGYEGLMIKPVNGVYECKRSKNWLKVKPVIEVTLKVVDVEEGTGRNEGLLGALVCEGTDMGKFIRVNVGTGLSDADRVDLWKAREEVIGHMVEIKADQITIGEDASHYSLRFPRFKTFRGFSPNQKM